MKLAEVLLHVMFYDNKRKSHVYKKLFLLIIKACNPLTPRVKPWVIQSFLTFDCMDRTLKCQTIYWKAVEQYFTVVLFCFSIFPSL